VVVIAAALMLEPSGNKHSGDTQKGGNIHLPETVPGHDTLKPFKGPGVHNLAKVA